jgi:DNA recombination protein RmuC
MIGGVDATWLALGALAVLALLNLALLWRRGREAEVPLAAEQIEPLLERLERELRDELGRQAQANRGDLTRLQQLLLTQGGEAARTQNELLQRVAQSTDLRLGEMRAAVEARLKALQDGNDNKLEQMRATVDEKLHATLEQRLGESFRQVAERLEQVHQGLGEMQGLARDVGSLSRVLSNVKARGLYGEVQLAALLEQVFAPAQYASNVETVPGSGARVEFAVRLPGRGEGSAPLWLPIYAKFPREDYERLLEAQDRADAAAAETAARALEARFRLEARTIRQKYLAAPHTTDFAILFLPTESLYAEALRRPGLVEELQREHRVALAGPTTLLALLSSLQMGFRTLAIEQRSAEVWQLLGAVKTEFAKFGDVLAKTKKKLDEASQTIDAAEVRTRAMARRLKTVESLSDEQARSLLPPGLDGGADDSMSSVSGAGPDAAASRGAGHGAPL